MSQSKDIETARKLIKQMMDGEGRHNSNLDFRPEPVRWYSSWWFNCGMNCIASAVNIAGIFLHPCWWSILNAATAIASASIAVWCLSWRR